MDAIRKILTDAQDAVTVELPPSFRHRPIEVVVTALNADPAGAGGHSATDWPADFFKRVAGGWSGEPLTHAPQGSPEQCAPLYCTEKSSSHPR